MVLDEVGAAAIDTGFGGAAGGDWEVTGAGPGAFAPTTTAPAAAGASWDAG